jgi:hypothetical protein
MRAAFNRLNTGMAISILLGAFMKVELHFVAPRSHILVEAL